MDLFKAIRIENASSWRHLLYQLIAVFVVFVGINTAVFPRNKSSPALLEARQQLVFLEWFLSLILWALHALQRTSVIHTTGSAEHIFKRICHTWIGLNTLAFAWFLLG